MTTSTWRVTRGDDLLLATAIHAGHELRPAAQALIALDDAGRLREEDPFTDRWVDAAGSSVVVDRSRFEVDLNRVRDAAVYRRPEDAWGLDVWTHEPSDQFVADSLALYAAFYAEVGDLCDAIIGDHGRIVVLDLHSYNHRRQGPDAAVDDPDANPEINLGTESVDPTWRDVVDAFAGAVREQPVAHGHLDVRENVRFKGGAMSRWINGRYRDRGCSIAVEVKKIYMDEWTGVLDGTVADEVGRALHAGAGAVRAAVPA